MAINDQAQESWATRAKANQITLGLWVLAFLPLFVVFLIWSWNRPSYQFFPVALIAAGMLASRAGRESGRMLSPGNLLITRCLVLGAAIVFLVANVLWSPWLNFIAFLLGITSVFWGLGGNPLCLAFLPAILMLVIILPPPLNMDESLTLWLRSVATKSSCALLDWLGVINVQDGNTIQLPGRTLLMEEACSGINSFVLCNALCLFWLLWLRRPLAWLWLAFPATSIFVIIGNIFRITTCAWIYYRWHLDLLSGLSHTIFGLILLLGYCGLVLSLEQLLAFFFQSPSLAKPNAPANPPPISRRASQPVLGFKHASVILAVVGMAFFAGHLFRRGNQAATYSSADLAREIDLTMPESLAGWDRINSNSGNLTMVQTLGIHSRSWQYENGGIVAILAADYPLDGYHDVSVCYRNSGWLVLSASQVLVGTNHVEASASQLELEKNQQHAVVFQSVIDARGNWLARPKALGSRFIPAPALAGYRIQLISAGDGDGYVAMSKSTENQLTQLYFAARQILVPQIVQQLAQTHNK